MNQSASLNNRAYEHEETSAVATEKNMLHLQYFFRIDLFHVSENNIVWEFSLK